MTHLRRALFGYSAASVSAVLAERELALQRASTGARSCEERAERLAGELGETQALLERAEDRFRAAQDLGEKIAADLDDSVAAREAMEAQLESLRKQLENVSTMLAATEDMVADRDERLRAEAERLRAAAERTSTLEADHRASLSAERSRVVELERLLAEYRAELEERALAAAPTPGVDAPIPPDHERERELRERELAEHVPEPSTAEELATVLQVTEEAVVRIIESTKVRVDEELRTVDADRERIRREVESMTAWRDRAAPMIASMQTTMDELVRQVGDVGPRVGEVLQPVTARVTSLTSELASLDSLAGAAQFGGRPHRSEGARVIELREDPAGDRGAARDQ
jgi:DNA repair exonuclease SbcCD ATPase subunit